MFHTQVAESFAKLVEGAPLTPAVYIYLIDPDDEVHGKRDSESDAKHLETVFTPTNGKVMLAIYYSFRLLGEMTLNRH